MKRVCSFFLFGLLMFNLSAQTSADRLAYTIASGNAQVLSAAEQYRAELNEAQQENVLEGIDVDFDYKFNATVPGENRWGISVAQGFDWPGVYAARRKANGYRAEAFEFLAKRALCEKYVEARMAINAVAAAKERLSILEDIQANTMAMAEKYRVAAQQQASTILELKKFEITAFDLACRVAEARKEYDSSMANLLALNPDMNVAAPDDALEVAELMPIDYYTALYEANNPALQANKSMINVSAAEVSVAKRSAWPSIKLGYAHDFEDSQHFNGFSIGIALPSWNNKHKITAARARNAALTLDAAEYVNVEAAALSSCYSTAAQAVQALSCAAGAFDGKYPEILKKALDNGAINVLDYLRENADYLEAGLQYVDVRRDYADAMVQLNKYNCLKW